MGAMQAAVLPRTRAADYATDDADHHARTGGGDAVRSRPDLRLVHRAESSATAAPAATAPAAAGQAVPTPAPVAAGATALTQRPVTLPPAGQPQARQPAPPLRLTRRGRVVVAAMAALLVVALSLIAAGAAQAFSHAGSPHPAGSNLAQAVVRPGQSLWSVAETADPNADTRLVIQQIIQLNSLNGDTVFAGQRLWVPRA